MYTNLLALAFLVTAVPAISAQETSAPARLPACVTTCYGLAVARANCDTLSPSCICGSNVFFAAVRNCLTTRDGTCTQEEAIDIWNKLQEQCADKISAELPSLSFGSITPTIGSIVPDPTSEPDSISHTMGTITGPGNFTYTSPLPTLGTITGPGETSEIGTSQLVTTSRSTAGGESSMLETQISQTTAPPSAPTQAPSIATNIFPSIISLIVGGFLAGIVLPFLV